MAVSDAAPSQVVRGQFDRNAIARRDPDKVHTDLPGDVGQDRMAVFQLDPKHPVRERFDDRALHLNHVPFVHVFDQPPSRRSLLFPRQTSHRHRLAGQNFREHRPQLLVRGQLPSV